MIPAQTSNAFMISGFLYGRECRNDPEQFAIFLDENWPMGRMGTPEEVANVAVFLSSPNSSLVNGASILVDGGECPTF